MQANSELKDGGAIGPTADWDRSASEQPERGVGVNRYGASGWPGAWSLVVALE